MKSPLDTIPDQTPAVNLAGWPGVCYTGLGTFDQTRLPLNVGRWYDMVRRGNLIGRHWPLTFTGQSAMVRRGRLIRHLVGRRIAAESAMLVSRVRGGAVSPSPDTEPETPHLVYHIATPPSHPGDRGARLAAGQSDMLVSRVRTGGIGVPSPLVSGLHAEPHPYNNSIANSPAGCVVGDAD